MTYNQIIKRIQEICQGHRQIRNFYKGIVSDFLAEKTTLFPSSFLQDNGNGNISIGQKTTSFPFRIFLLDLVHLSEDTKTNEQDVLSDMSLIAIDIVAQLSAFYYTDWRVSSDNPTQFLIENENDFIAGIIVDFRIDVPFTKDKCQIPTSGMPIIINDRAKYVEDMVYIANGSEGKTLTIPALKGKKILFISRESAVIYEVSNNPASTEFVWDGIIITLGLETNPDERYLILYRNY